MKITASVTNDLVTDQRVHKVCTTLLQNGYEVKLVGRKFRNSKPLQRAYRTDRMRLLFNRSVFFYAEYNLRLFFYLLFDKADIYLSNDTDSLPANYLAAKIRRKPLVFDAHEMFPEVPEVTQRKFVKAVWTKMEDWIFPHLKNTYTVCQSIADIYNRKYGIDMQVVRNIPSVEQTTHVQPAIDTKGKKIILYQGAVNVGRGIEWIIDAMPYLPDFLFYVVGDGDVLNDLKEKVNRQNLNDRVIFTGRIPFEELPAYTICADIGINLLENKGLNYYYSLPNRIFDYIRKNIPVLATDFPEIRRIVAHYGIGTLVAHYDPPFLAATIRQMATEEKNMEGFATANAELSWENEAQTLLRLIRQTEDQSGSLTKSILQKTATECIDKIKKTDFNRADISDYNRQYINRLLPHLAYYFDIYIQTLAALPSMQPGQNPVVDFGGGHGFLGLFLKSLGYEVIYCDINPLSVKTISWIKQEWGFGPDYIIQGGADELKVFCESKQIKPGWLIATDLIEHVYDLSAFFRMLKQINPDFEMVFTTGSNPKNSYKCRQLRRFMKAEEKTYLSVRKYFISNNSQGLNEAEIDKLALLSRGKTLTDIQKILDNYRETRIFPRPLQDPYNTCDPETGNWSERILPLGEYKQLASEAEFQATFELGFHNEKRNRKIISGLFRCLNFFIRKTGKAGFVAAPYILIKLSSKYE
jgi:glycosyltransferase involved in cell wall biosynthesis/2-polyprenyl-3-methyl-5-hydroxy-6-metoxy-1,4-benzoquinol methylase